MAEKQPSVAELAYSFFKKYGHAQINNQEKQILQYWRKNFYLWTAGVYRELDREEVEARLVRHLSDNYMVATTNMVNNVVLNLGAQAFVMSARVPDTWFTSTDVLEPVQGVVLNNGIAVVDSIGKVDVLPHTPDFFALGKLPYDYTPEAVCVRWMQFLDEVTDGDKGLQRLLQQWAGYLLISSGKFQSFLLLIGEAGAGKGTYARAMKAMLGKQNCSDIPLRRFTDKFSLYLTYGKKLNVVGDAEQELTPQAEAVIKTWTGEDGLDHEKKYGKGFCAEPTAKLMILANDFPTFTDKSDGTWRRLKVVPLHRKDPNKVEPGLDETLRGELPGILNWAFDGLRDLEENNGFAVPMSSKTLWQGFKEESNPAKMFLTENYEFDTESNFGVQALHVYTAYRAWCKAKGYQPMSDKTFGKEIKRAFPGVSRRKLGSRETRIYVYAGVKMQRGAEIIQILRRG